MNLPTQKAPALRYVHRIVSRGGRADMAVKIPTLASAVPYYGGQPTAEEAEKIKTPIMAHYAGLETKVNEGWPAFEAILKKIK